MADEITLTGDVDRVEEIVELNNGSGIVELDSSAEIFSVEATPTLSSEY